MRRIVVPFLVLALAGCTTKRESHVENVQMTETKSANGNATEVTFSASDGRKVFADLYTSNHDKAIILLFHQARSNAGEYSTIAPRLEDEGYTCLAVDLRSGGDMWGKRNRTAITGADYMSAYADMKGALDWAKRKGYKTIVVMGSSYSASLAIRLASESDGISAVVACSPGEYFTNKMLVQDWNRANKIPTMMAFTEDELNDSGGSLWRTSAKNPERAGKDMMISDPSGVHGASTFREDRNPDSSGKYWQQLTSFLRRTAPVNY